MWGIALLIVAVLLYVFGQKRWSFLIYIFFLSNGFSVLTDDVIGAKNADLAVVYTAIVFVFSFFRERNCAYEDKWLRRFVQLFFFFLAASAFYSNVHYRFSWYQILQGGRHLFLFMGYFFVIKAKPSDVLWLVEKVYKITVVISILYVIQVLGGYAVLPYSREVQIDPATGLGRYYNAPLSLPLAIYLLLFEPSVVKSPTKVFDLVVLVGAQVCTLGRVEIAVTFMMVLLGILLKGSGTAIVRVLFVVSLLLFPAAEILESRFTMEGDTEMDLSALVRGSYREVTEKGKTEGGTLTYRIAWIYERYKYLQDRPTGEKVFGLGMISDSQTEIVRERYDFKVGLENEETGEVVQLGTPDIAYGNMLTHLGFGGGALLMVIWLYMAWRAFCMRGLKPFENVLTILLIGYMLRSLSGSIISETGNLILPFMMFATYLCAEQRQGSGKTLKRKLLSQSVNDGDTR
ncbi:MAG: hypothetical protein IJ196_02735 [Prevotella sp.]|nr:hypothetical protein [Prevotella sp.]